jgi:2-oxo-4-hydroxy-4-carboxy-5-ureidoimidazoline decarboxylase
MTISQINRLDRAQFVELLGTIYEHSPWVAEQVWSQHPFASRDELCESMHRAVEASGRTRQIDLLCAHPDLGTRAAIGAFSTSEQMSAGLNQLSPEEYTEIMALNRRYRTQFGFPFIMAVRGASKYQILTALQSRVESEPEREMIEALTQVHRIAAFRLCDLIEEQ